MPGMIAYIDAVKRGFIEQYHFPENPEKPGCVLGVVPDGSYPMQVFGKTDNVSIVNGKIHCCNFESSK